MKIRKSYLAMIKAQSGGMDAMSAKLMMSRHALENRLYETKGQWVSVDLAMKLQEFSGTTLFAEAIAAKSGGTFVKLPADLVDGNELLAKKFRDVSVQFGKYAEQFEESIRGDDEIDAKERAELQAIGNAVHRSMAELMSLTFRVYCRPDVDGGAA